MTAHKTKIMVTTIVSLIIILAVLALTPIGQTIDLATQHFLLFYAGVVCLMALCTSVAFGLISTDRMFLHPGQRVLLQAAHRAVSFGTIFFLYVHVVTEILAQRANVIDAFVPFLEPFKAFYIGLGTIAGDLMLLVVVTSVFRTRFIENGKAWQWRAIHYTAYVFFVFGIWHGLLAGRAAKPYYDWTYGIIITLALFGLGARVLSTSLKPKEALSTPPLSESASSAAAPLRAAAMLAQFGATMPGGGRNNVLTAASTQSQPTIAIAAAAPAPTAAPMAALPSAEPAQPVQYEPGYEGPARRMGAPRDTGAMQRPNTGAMPRMNTGAMPRMNTGAMPRANTGAMPRATGPAPMMGGSGAYPTQQMDAARMGGSGGYPTQQMDPRMGGNGAYPPPPMEAPRTGGSGAYPTQQMPPADWQEPMPRSRTGAMPQYDDGYGQQGPRGGGPRGGERGRDDHGWDEPRMDPRQRPMTGEMPQAGYGYQDSYQDNWDQGGRDRDGWAQDQGWDDQNRGQDQRWMEASHDGGGYEEPQQQWDNGGGYYPDADPRGQYGEPGYGARDPRYGGDRY